MKIVAGVSEGADCYIIHDLENDCKLEGAILWADDIKGEYCQYAASVSNGEIVYKRDGGELVKEIKRAAIKLIDLRLTENRTLLKRIDPDGWWKENC